MFSDLECDYINPIDLCNKLNQVRLVYPVPSRTHAVRQFVIPENLVHAFLALLFLMSGQWTALLFNVPLVAYNANKYAIDMIVHTLYPSDDHRQDTE